MSGSGSGTQFESVVAPWKVTNSQYRYTQYNASDSNDTRPYTEAATVTVEHPVTNYDLTPELDAYQRTYSRDMNLDRHRTQTGEGDHGQGALFDVYHRKPYVSYLASHPEYRGHVGTLLGVAALETKQRFGELPVPDSDLSVHSSRIVHRLAQSGAVEAPRNETRNDFTADNFTDFQVPNRNFAPGQVSDIPRSTINMGRHLLREALRRPKQAVKQSIIEAGAKKGFKQERMF